MTPREEAAVWAVVAREQDQGRCVSSRWTYGHPYGDPDPRVRGKVRAGEVPDLVPEPVEVVAQARTRRARSNRAALSKLLPPTSRRRARLVWAGVSEATGIPVRTLKAWWWGVENVTAERTAAIRAHVEARTDQPPLSRAVAGKRTP